MAEPIADTISPVYVYMKLWVIIRPRLGGTMKSVAERPLLPVLIVMLAVGLLAVVLAGCGQDGENRRAALGAADGLPSPPSPDSGSPLEPPDKKKSELSDSTLQEAVENLAAGEPPPDEVVTKGKLLAVEVVVEPGELDAARLTITDLGGELKGSIPGLLQAHVPAGKLAALENKPQVQFLRVPSRQAVQTDAEQSMAGGSIIGEEIAKTGIDTWHEAGKIGTGTQIGIIDYFNGTDWGAARNAGEVPAPAGPSFCRLGGTGCGNTFWSMNSKHGVGVAEIIHEMVPGADLYLATTRTPADTRAAIDYFAQQGVDIISRSLTAEYDSAGNGTGPWAEVVDYAVDRGMAWFNSAGNSAGRGDRAGSYWRGFWRDTDGDGFLEFGAYDENEFDSTQASNAELLPFNCGFINGLRWSDWNSGNPTDYDLYIRDYEGNQWLSEDYQQEGSLPMEHIDCPGSQTFYASIKVWPGLYGNGTDGDILEFMVNKGAIYHGVHVNRGSAGQPVADSHNPGMMAIGAVDPAVGTEIASYSSEGPTNDSQIKPDISAAACVASYTYRDNTGACNGGFSGTSAATPVVAGVAAVVLGHDRSLTPASLVSYLRDEAIVDRGVPGPDNVYGVGELRLPAPPKEGGGGGGGGGDGGGGGSGHNGDRGRNGKENRRAQRQCKAVKRQLVRTHRRYAIGLRRLAKARNTRARRRSRRFILRARAARVRVRAKRIRFCNLHRNRRR